MSGYIRRLEAGLRSLIPLCRIGRHHRVPVAFAIRYGETWFPVENIVMCRHCRRIMLPGGGAAPFATPEGASYTFAEDDR